MTTAEEIPDEDHVYGRLTTRPTTRAETRGLLRRLGGGLADAAAARAGGDERVLCVVLLRGGALLYPGFADRFGTADFLLLGLKRAGDTVDCDYSTHIPHDRYDCVVYIDCVAATGNTILAARRTVAAGCRAGRELAAVVCSSAPATAVLAAAGVGLIGYSLHEAVDAGVVSPDMGELDAGDLFSGVRARMHSAR